VLLDGTAQRLADSRNDQQPDSRDQERVQQVVQPAAADSPPSPPPPDNLPRVPRYVSGPSQCHCTMCPAGRYMENYTRTTCLEQRVTIPRNDTNLIATANGGGAAAASNMGDASLVIDGVLSGAASSLQVQGSPRADSNVALSFTLGARAVIDTFELISDPVVVNSTNASHVTGCELWYKDTLSLNTSWQPVAGLRWLGEPSVPVSGGTISGNAVTMNGQHIVQVRFQPVVATGLRVGLFDASSEASDAEQYVNVCNEVRCGSSDCNEDSYCAPRDELHEVACCSDVNLEGWRSCSVGGATVYGERDAGSLSCTSSATLVEALDTCEGVGARLCTAAELEAGCTIGTGCSFDADLLWSSTSEASGAPEGTTAALVLTEIALRGPGSASIDVQAGYTCPTTVHEESSGPRLGEDLSASEGFTVTHTGAHAMITHSSQLSHSLASSQQLVFSCCPSEPCEPPAGWCSSTQNMTVELWDCDGDSVVDPICTGPNGEVGALLSSQNCADSWPTGECTPGDAGGAAVDIPASFQTVVSDCTSCQPGKADLDLDPITLCELCQPGEYQAERSQTSCKDCPRGTYNPLTGASSRTNCVRATSNDRFSPPHFTSLTMIAMLACSRCVWPGTMCSGESRPGLQHSYSVPRLCSWQIPRHSRTAGMQRLSVGHVSARGQHY
jgi:hypothetical protein